MPRRKLPIVESEIERQLRALPPDIPFQVLGLDSEHYYMIDGGGLFRTLPRDKMGHMLAISLVGENQDWAFYHYARWRKSGKDIERVPRSLQPELLGQDIALLAQQKGAFNPQHSVRMQGAWLGLDGDLILHCGDKLWIRGAFVPTGMRGEHAYPVEAPRWLPPHNEPVGPEIGDEVLNDLARWQFGRKIDATLLLGELALGLVPAAMRTRPNILLLGEHGVGKSGLLERIEQYLGHRMLYTADFTAAGITQSVGHKNLLIGLDERDNLHDPKRAEAVLALLRNSYTGTEQVRGGQDHKAVSVSMRCAIIAAASEEPQLGAADRSRNVCITVVGPPKERGLLLVYDARRAAIGAMLLRRIADRWTQLQLETLPAWDALLREIGFDGRGVDTIGTLLSLAWLLCEDRAPTRSDAEWIADDLSTLLREDRAERSPTYDRFLQHVLSLPVDPMRKGEWRTMLELTKLAGGWGMTAATERRTEENASDTAKLDDAAIDAQRQLSRMGIRIMRDDQGERTFVIAHQSSVLADMLRGTSWAGLPGRSSPWAKILLRAPEARTIHARFASGVGRAVELKLSWVLRGMVGPDPEGDVVRWEQRALANV